MLFFPENLVTKSLNCPLDIEIKLWPQNLEISGYVFAIDIFSLHLLLKKLQKLLVFHKYKIVLF